MGRGDCWRRDNKALPLPSALCAQSPAAHCALQSHPVLSALRVFLGPLDDTCIHEAGEELLHVPFSIVSTEV